MKHILRRLIFISSSILLIFVCLILALFFELLTGHHILPYDPYHNCGMSPVEVLPETVRIGFYEEFPVAWRLDKLAQVDFPVSLAIAAPSRQEFLALRTTILRQYPQVQTVYFWAMLNAEEGYYPGTWSDANAIQRIAHDADSLPTLWDLELPPNLQGLSLDSWRTNQTFLDEWFSQREEPLHIWRSHTSMGLNSSFLRWIGLHYDPNDYPMLYLHINLYTTGTGQPADELSRILRCGVEQYGERFIPSFGLLNDGEGVEDIFVPVETLRRSLQLAREAGVSEIWLFGVNGINENYLNAVRETVPVEH